MIPLAFAVLEHEAPSESFSELGSEVVARFGEIENKRFEVVRLDSHAEVLGLEKDLTRIRR